MPLVSVLVPVYNAEKYIKKCLDSICNQSLKDYEVVIIDDGSTDDSGAICDAYAERYKNVNVYHKENQGLISARIDGIKNARGEYLTFVDADDWIGKDFLEILFNNIEIYNADLVVSGCIQERKDVSIECINAFRSGVYNKQQLVTEIYPKMLCYNTFYKFGILPYVWNKIYKKRLLIECYKDIDASIYDGEDVAVVYLYLLKCERLVILDESKYHYRIHNASMTVNKKDNYYENVSKLYLHLDKAFRESDYYEVLLPQLEQYMRMMVWQKKTENFIRANKHIFPFDKVPKGAQIVLYGAGLVGKNYYYQITQISYCNIVKWVDKNYRDGRLSGLNINNPQSINSILFDYVVVAIDNEKIKHEVKAYLLEMGIDEKRIVV